MQASGTFFIYVFGLPGQSDIIAYLHGVFDNTILAFRLIYFFILFGCLVVLFRCRDWQALK